MKTPAIRTAAEETILALAGSGEAASFLAQNGLPTRRVEDWHYTDLRGRLKSVPPVLNGSLDLTVSDNVEVTRAIPERAMDEENFVRSINSALANDGVSLVIPPAAGDNTKAELTVLRPGSAHVHIRNAVVIGAKASATLIFNNQAGDEELSFTSMVSDIKLEAGAELTVVSTSQENAVSTQLNQLNFTLGENARLSCLMINQGGQTTRTELIAEFAGEVAGEGAHADFYGINLATGNELTDIRLKLNHAVPNTTSEEKFRCVIAGEGHSVFQGAIRVAPDAQKSDAQMMTKGLLLSEAAQFSVKPELEIFADDVLCAHGATSGDIDAEALFYLMARGIPEPEAMTLLVNAFVGELLDDVGDETLTAPLRAQVSSWLADVNLNG